MSADEHELRTAWSRFVSGSRESRRLFESLVGRHREPHRRYHGLRHVVWVVRHAEQLAQTEPVGDLGAVVLAACFHDAIYDPRAAGNEAASARLAEQALAGVGWDADRCHRVAAMIEATAHHAPHDDDDTAVLVDADLAVLGSDPAGYQTYVTGVRAEYAHVPDDEWRIGRAAVLRSLTERPSVFTTATGRRLWEARARANIAAEVASLTAHTYG